nr:hypothetical protein [Candidatus Sigynarchaeota archaeon]
TVRDFYSHFIMRGIESLALKSTCSIELVQARDVDVHAIAHSPATAGEFSWNGVQWVEGKPKKHVVIAVAKYGAGKVVGVGTTRVLSTLLNKRHGFKAADNEKLVANMLAWLINREVYEKGKLKAVFVNVSLKPDLYFWIEEELKNHDQFRDFNEVVNFSIDTLRRGIDKFRATKE